MAAMKLEGETAAPPKVAGIRRWLSAKLRQELPAAIEIDADKPLTDYGLSSVTTIGVTADLEDWLGLELDPVIFFDYPTLAELADYLAAAAASSRSITAVGDPKVHR